MGVLELQFKDQSFWRKSEWCPIRRKWVRVFNKKKWEVNAGLHKLFTKNLDWRENLSLHMIDLWNAVHLLLEKVMFC